MKEGKQKNLTYLNLSSPTKHEANILHSSLIQTFNMKPFELKIFNSSDKVSCVGERGSRLLEPHPDTRGFNVPAM